MDSECRRTVRAGCAVYVYDALGSLAAEYSTVAQAAGTMYLTGDHLGSTRVISKGPAGAASVAERRDYQPFGEEIAPVSTDPRRNVTGYPPAGEGIAQKFTSKERDAETGLDYFGARYFSSAQGRFTSPDEFIGGVGGAYGSRPQQPGPLPYADLTNPQSLNKYVYALNNPLRFIDPDGHESEEEADPKDTKDPKNLPKPEPSFKLISKTREGAKVIKKYHPPATPCERLLESARICTLRQTLLPIRR